MEVNGRTKNWAIGHRTTHACRAAKAPPQIAALKPPSPSSPKRAGGVMSAIKPLHNTANVGVNVCAE